MKVAKNMVVSFDYVLNNDKGENLDSSTKHGPLEYLHGFGNIIPGLESALEGKNVGDQFEVSVAPKDAYGEYNPALVQTLNKDQFSGVDQVSEGMQFKVDTEGGPLVVRVSEVNGENVTIDGNHPLAGQNLNFNVTIANIREASSTEIEHGHVHS